MRIKRFSSAFICILTLFLLNSCEYPELSGEKQTSYLSGTWVDPVYGDSITSYKRSSGLIKDTYGIQFLPDNQLILRAIAGPCATPPVVYADSKGVWQVSDSVLTMQVPFWGGQMRTTWRIWEITDNHLRMQFLYQVENP